MPDETPEETVPKSEMLRRLKAKQSKIDAIQLQLDEHLELARTAPTPGQVDEWRSKYESVEREYTDFRSAQETKDLLYKAGVTDPDVQDLVRYRHGKLGEDAPDLASWLAEGAAADPLLAPHLAPAAAPPAAEGAPAAAPPAAAPPPRTGKPPPAPSPGLTYESLNSMTKAERLARREEIHKMFNG